MSFNQRWLSVVVAVCGLYVFAGTNSATSVLELSRKPANLAPSSLSCVDLNRIGQWGQKKAQGVAKEAMDSDAFRLRAVKVFLEKVDPFRLLLLESEVKSFTASTKSHWGSVLSGTSCDSFVAWFDSMLPVMRARMERLYATTAVSAFAQISFASIPSEPELPEYSDFARDENELKQRYTETLKAMAKATSSYSVRAFKNDLKTLLKQDLEQLAFGETAMIPLELLMKGILGAIDPYSTYLSPSEFEEFYYDLAGATSGVGVLVRKVPEGLLVLKTVEGSPARLSRTLFPGDIMLEINGRKLKDLPELEAKNLLKGQENTRVTLVVRALDPKAGERRITITRREFSFEEARVNYKLVDAKAMQVKGMPANRKGKVAVFSIPSFYGRGGMGSLTGERSSAEDLRHSLEQVLSKEKDLAAVVLDVRDNPGGFLEEAVTMAGLFIGDRPVVTVMENNRKRVLRDSVADPIYTGPVVVLTDNQSASAAEVLAGALQDYQRALVVGDRRTYGKGSVQKLFHLDQEFMGANQSVLSKPRGVVKLTTSIFFSPRGHTPINGGVKADIALNRAKATKGVGNKVVYHAVADGSSAIDAIATKRLDTLRKANLLRVAEIERRHEVRMKDITDLIDITAKKQLGIYGKPSDQQVELAEAVAIARDYAQAIDGQNKAASRVNRSDLAGAQ